MEKLCVDLAENSYDILFSDSFSALPQALENVTKSKKGLIVTDSNVDKLYAGAVEKLLSENDFSVGRFVFPAGEENKNMKTILDICKACLEQGLDRNSFVAALGGGVAGDMAGFAAAIYMRGIDFVQIPTTLLSQSDSSVGGKTGVDFMDGKNILGAFHQPKLVYINVDVLKTLPEREFVSGMGEVIKHGIIADKAFLDYIAENSDSVKKLDTKTLLKMCKKNCAIKAAVVSRDEKEQGLRAILNFGHTVGHAVETYYKFKLSHGECVGIGMYAAAVIAKNRMMISETELNTLTEVLEKYGFELHVKLKNPRKIIEIMHMDKKAHDGILKFILPCGLGKVTAAENVTEGEILTALKAIDKG